VCGSSQTPHQSITSAGRHSGSVRRGSRGDPLSRAEEAVRPAGSYRSQPRRAFTLCACRSLREGRHAMCSTRLRRVLRGLIVEVGRPSPSGDSTPLPFQQAANHEAVLSRPDRRPPKGPEMPWIHESAVGRTTVTLCYGRSGSYPRRLGLGTYPGDGFRLSGRRLRIVIRRRPTPNPNQQPSRPHLRA
jgi:hypothetical protein